MERPGKLHDRQIVVKHDNRSLLDNVCYKMIAPAPSKKQIVTLGISGIVLFLLGFLIGYFTIPIDDSENKSNTPSSTIEELRKSQAEKKEKYHSELYNALNKSEIGKNVKYDCIILLLDYTK